MRQILNFLLPEVNIHHFKVAIMTQLQNTISFQYRFLIASVLVYLRTKFEEASAIPSINNGP